ncbi:aspartyl-phosphate phosphatase Spo0E family protein [uncultured Clostridium sp.]|uniref:aspartyl-phosphate phosphatase Spo0E family protein n=1 Tax=uncultured Clostridium sp. TaxID=59620 RepID=UPI0028E98DE6|nr:aspartyl-phosphate phosphatase Spo0E family protein [uncultured Clostridium sp.]
MIDLRNNIESLREKLYFLILSKELNDIEVLICSQKLDRLLARYQKKIGFKE